MTQKIKGFIYLNGKILEMKQAKIPVLDHGFLYGDSVYETLRTYNGYPLQLKDHIDRLFRSAKSIHLPPPKNKKQFKAIILKTIQAYFKKFKKEDVYIRIIISRGFGDIGFDLHLCPSPNLIIIMKKVSVIPQKHYQNGVHLILVPRIRNNPKALDPNIKSGNYLNNLLAYLEAKRKGGFDAIMLNAQGHLTEGTRSNLFLVHKNKLYTPHLKSGLLKGLTRSLIFETCKKHKIPLIEKTLKPKDLFLAQEAFTCSSLQAILPVVRVSRKKIGKGKPGPLTKKLMHTFQNAIEDSIRREHCLDS